MHKFLSLFINIQLNKINTCSHSHISNMGTSIFHKSITRYFCNKPMGISEDTNPQIKMNHFHNLNKKKNWNRKNKGICKAYKDNLQILDNIFMDRVLCRVGAIRLDSNQLNINECINDFRERVGICKKHMYMVIRIFHNYQFHNGSK